MEKTINIKQEALKNGLIWGGINIGIFLITWYTMPNLMGETFYSVLTSFVGIFLAVFFTLDLRKKVGGYWTFNEAIWPIFVTFLMSMTLMYVFSVVFSKYIDLDYAVKMKEMVMSSSEKMFKGLGLSGDDFDKAMETTTQKLEEQFNPNFKQMISGYGISAIMYFIGAVIFALIFKKNNPNPFAQQEETAQ